MIKNAALKPGAILVGLLAVGLAGACGSGGSGGSVGGFGSGGSVGGSNAAGGAISTSTSAAGTGVSFRAQILPMLTANCVSCHGPTKQSLGVRVDTYEYVSNSLDSVTEMLVGGGMPPTGPLSDTDQQLFQDWVDQGALNN